MTTEAYTEWALTAASFICFVVCFLKGRYAVIILSLAAGLLSPVPIFGTYWHHIITEPLQWWPLIAVFRLAKPSSIWADRFYNEAKMQLARKRYPTANPVPRSLQKQAIHNLKAIERGDYSVSAEGGWKAIADRLNKAGWTWGCTERVDSNGKTIFVADAQQGDGKRFIVRADDELTAFVELERQIRTESGAAPSALPLQSAAPAASVVASKAPRKRPVYATLVAAVVILVGGALCGSL